MKTKNLSYLAIILVAAIALAFSSCAKDDLEAGMVNPVSLEQLAVDENNVENMLKDAEVDVTNAMSVNSDMSPWLPCNATITSVGIVNDSVVLVITYNGLSCNGKINRTGKIEIKKKASTYWAQAGATIIYKYIDYTVTRVATGKSVKLNGTKTFVNVNGGNRWKPTSSNSSYVERISGTMQASFDNGAIRKWNVARQVTYTGTAGQYILTIDGFGSAGGYQNLVVWGTNRQGEEFYTQITQSIVSRQTCDWDPVSGVKVHQIPSDSKSATITFGYNNNNEPVSGNECPTRYRVDWQKNNKSGTSYLPL